ncbi:MAG: sulfotransferase [Marivibrio sp.]|uniref:sulfotransferase n=1 Tax=Marivibrio sp. TaxID=2039719 RepID=UPI0032EBBEC6
MRDRDADKGTPAGPVRPILIRALRGRSGTNHLADLLARHPDVALCEVAEDMLSFQAGKLVEYADGLFGVLSEIGRAQDLPPARRSADALTAGLGEALAAYLGAPAVPRPLFKSPAFQDERAALRLMPTASLVVLLRDPRSIAESAVRAHWGQGRTPVAVGADWAKAARRLDRFLSDSADLTRAGRVHLVRFEALAERPRKTLAALLGQLDLAATAEVLDYAEAAPVIGSSYLPRDPSGLTDFRPQPRPEGFDPRTRWAHWGPKEHKAFNRVCGVMMERFGYKMARF